MNIHAIQDTNDATAATAATAATETKETDITTTTTSTVSDATLPFLYCLNLVRTKKDNKKSWFLLVLRYTSATTRRR